MNDNVKILGVRMDNLTMEEAVSRLASMAKEDKVHTVFTPNSEILYIAKKDPEFREILNASDLNTADGIGVVYAGKILKDPIKERVAGFDLASAFLPVMEREGLSLFLFGSGGSRAKGQREAFKTVSQSADCRNPQRLF